MWAQSKENVSRTKSAALRLEYVVNPKVMQESEYFFIPSVRCEVGLRECQVTSLLAHFLLGLCLDCISLLWWQQEGESQDTTVHLLGKSKGRAQNKPDSALLPAVY